MKFFKSKFFLAIVSIIFFAFYVSAEILFSEPTINTESAVLFNMRDTVNAAYDSVVEVNLKHDVPSTSAQILTCYPEQMEILSSGAYLQIRNKYGSARYNVATKSFVWTQKNWLLGNEATFAFGARSSKYSVSPNGKWLCRLQKTGVATSDLLIEDVATGSSFVIVQNVIFDNENLPIKWTANGSVLFYEKNGDVYFLTPDAFFRKIEVNEENRKIGNGNINSISVTNKSIFYIDGDCVYKINLRELYTLGLYSEIIGTGTALGRLSDIFVPSKDYFSVSESGTSLVVVRGGKNITMYDLPSAGGNYLHVTSSVPYFSEKGSVAASKIFWGTDSKPNFWFKLIPYDGSSPVSTIVKIFSANEISETTNLDTDIAPVISPDGTHAIVFSKNALSIYDATTWEKSNIFTGEKILSAVWLSQDVIYLGGEKTISKWDVKKNTKELITLSSAEKIQWYKDLPHATIGNKNFIYDKKNCIWRETNIPYPEQIVQNGLYRVYAGDATNANYANTIFYRTLSGSPTTNAIFSDSMKKNSEHHRQKVALVFDAYASTDGLPFVLSALNTYKVPATFFVNGEFIKRYPKETNQIANSVYDVGSLFFTEANLVSKTFSANEDFIRRGLARNEDLFFHTTKKELNLLWHAPHFYANATIKNAGAKSGYKYVESVLPRYDEITLEAATSQNLPYKNAAEIIENIIAALKKNNGGAVSVCTGILRGTRIDYLYEYTGLLIQSILDEGFEIVTAQDLLDSR